MLSEFLADPPLVVVQVLRPRAPFRQSGCASFVDFLLITGSSGCDAISVLCLLASPPPALLCGSLLLRRSPQALPTPQLSMRHFVIIGSRLVLGFHSAVVYNNVICCLQGLSLLRLVWEIRCRCGSSVVSNTTV